MLNKFFRITFFSLLLFVLFQTTTSTAFAARPSLRGYAECSTTELAPAGSENYLIGNRLIWTTIPGGLPYVLQGRKWMGSLGWGGWENLASIASPPDQATFLHPANKLDGVKWQYQVDPKGNDNTSQKIVVNFPPEWDKPNCNYPDIDIGLNIVNGLINGTSDTQSVAIENPAKSSHSPLKISSEGVVYSIALVPTTSSARLKARVKTSSGTMALKKFGADTACHWSSTTWGDCSETQCGTTGTQQRTCSCPYGYSGSPDCEGEAPQQSCTTSPCCQPVGGDNYTNATKCSISPNTDSTDETALSGYRNYAIVNTCTANKCEYQCDSSYQASGSSGSASCASIPPQCPAASLDIGSGLGASYPMKPSGQSHTAVCPLGHQGSPTRMCTNGSWGALTNGCLPSCTWDGWGTLTPYLDGGGALLATDGFRFDNNGYPRSTLFDHPVADQANYCSNGAITCTFHIKSYRMYTGSTQCLIMNNDCPSGFTWVTYGEWNRGSDRECSGSSHQYFQACVPSSPTTACPQHIRGDCDNDYACESESGESLGGCIDCGIPSSLK